MSKPLPLIISRAVDMAAEYLKLKSMSCLNYCNLSLVGDFRPLNNKVDEKSFIAFPIIIIFHVIFIMA